MFGQVSTAGTEGKKAHLEGIRAPQAITMQRALRLRFYHTDTCFQGARQWGQREAGRSCGLRNNLLFAVLKKKMDLKEKLPEGFKVRKAPILTPNRSICPHSWEWIDQSEYRYYREHPVSLAPFSASSLSTARSYLTNTLPHHGHSPGSLPQRPKLSDLYNYLLVSIYPL